MPDIPKIADYEEFKHYVGSYFFSNFGRVYNISKKKFLKPQSNVYGYQRVGIWINGKRKQTFIHIVVCLLFGDKNGVHFPIEGLRIYGESIDHINGDKKNNSVWNLEIVPHEENVRRYYERHEQEENRLEF